MALQPQQRTARRQAVTQTRTRALGVNTQAGDERLAIMNSLSKFAQAGSAEANRKQKAEIETQNVIGASRAAQDLATVEANRKGITEDDTLAAKLSYNAIVGQHETMQAGNDFTEWYQSNPAASEDEISAKKSELYKPLFEKYGDDDRSLKQISLQVQKSQFNLSAVQDKIKSSYNKKKNTEALTMSVSDMLADPNADIGTVINSEIPARAKALGLSEFEYKSTLMSEMVTRAGSGDNRLLEALKEEGWSKDSVLIRKASSSYEQFTSRENSIAIGDALGSIEIENRQLTVPWSTTLKKIERLNKEYPNAVSSAKVASMKQARASAVSKDETTTNIMKTSYETLFDENGIPLSMDGRYTPQQKKEFIKGLDKIFADKTQELVDSGVPQEEANTTMMKQRLDWSRANRIKVPLLDENLKGLLSLNPDDYPDGDNLPQFATNGFDVLRKMDEATMALYFSDEDAAFAGNIKSGLRNRSPYSAFKRAYNIKRNPFKATSEDRADVVSSVDTAVEDELTSNWAQKLMGGVDIQDWQVSQLKSRVRESAFTNLYNGMFDSEDNAKQALATTLQDYSPTFNGTMINMPKVKLAQDSGIQEKKVDSYLESFLLSNATYIRDEVGEDVEPEDISFDFAGNGTFVIRHKGSEQIGGRFSYSQLKEIGDTADLQELRSLRTETIKERDDDYYNSAHSSMFSPRWADSRK